MIAPVSTPHLPLHATRNETGAALHRKPDCHGYPPEAEPPWQSTGNPKALQFGVLLRNDIATKRLVTGLLLERHFVLRTLRGVGKRRHGCRHRILEFRPCCLFVLRTSRRTRVTYLRGIGRVAYLLENNFGVLAHLAPNRQERGFESDLTHTG